MSQRKTTLEIIAPTVDEAVAKGLKDLGLNRDAVEVEVLDAGSRGLFGLGGRQARVRLTIQTAEEEPQTPLAPVQPPQPVTPVEPVAPVVQETAPAAISSETPEDDALALSRQTVSDLLEKMKMQAQVTAAYVPSEETKEDTILVNIEGDDLSILIGRRSETLNALQYITSLIVCKELDRWVPLMIDVQGYRTRRERSLRTLARRMAEQAIHTGRRQVLEPMPANERRLIHLELKDHPSVTTESTGEEPNRKVTIFLKR